MKVTFNDWLDSIHPVAKWAVIGLLLVLVIIFMNLLGYQGGN